MTSVSNTGAVVSPPNHLHQNGIPAVTMRRTNRYLWGLEDATYGGVAGGFDHVIASLNVTIDKGMALVVGPDEDVYECLIDGSGLVNIDFTAPVSDSRYDVVGIRVWDNQEDGSGFNKCELVVVAGTASASPTVPALPARFTPLYVFEIDSGSTVTLTADARNTRTDVAGTDIGRAGILGARYSVKRSAEAAEPVIDGAGQLWAPWDAATVYTSHSGAWVKVADQDWGRWQSWTPTLTNFTGTVERAEYLPFGDAAKYVVVVEFTGVPTGTMGISLPAGWAPPSAGINRWLGAMAFQNVGQLSYPGWQANGAGGLVCGNLEAAGTWNATNPFTWAAGDHLRLEGWIERT